jgi:hypothetical protein
MGTSTAPLVGSSAGAVRGARPGSFEAIEVILEREILQQLTEEAWAAGASIKTTASEETSRLRAGRCSTLLSGVRHCRR